MRERFQREPTTGFCLGEGLFQTERRFDWEPETESNAHAIVWGASGSGKSYLLRRMIRHLQQSRKIVMVIDVHGDLAVAGENALVFGGPRPAFGLNPFEFDPQHRAGPGGQIDSLLATFRKTYLAAMGSVQELVLRQLIADLYRTAGIVADQPETWTRTPPTMADLRELLEAIQAAMTSGLGAFAQTLQQQGQQLEQWHADALALATAPGGQAGQAALQGKIATAKRTLMQAFEVYVERRYGPAAAGDTGDTLDVGQARLTLAPYRRKAAARALDSIGMYVAALDDHGIFHPVSPPVTAGVNRFDLSGLSDQARVFLTDTLLERLFRKLRARGEYQPSARGARVDTFVLVDEAQLVIPTRTKERDDPTQILNRLVSEARKFGAGLILVSQSPNVFPRAVLANVARKIGLRTQAIDIPAARRALGLADEQLFRQAQQPRVAMYSTREGGFEPVTLGSELDEEKS
jgi:DNA helicase HerA-like ATPase